LTKNNDPQIKHGCCEWKHGSDNYYKKRQLMLHCHLRPQNAPGRKIGQSAN